jgi:DNA-binding transcriptional MerR regulator
MTKPSRTPEGRRAQRESRLAARRAAGDLCDLEECGEPRERGIYCNKHGRRNERTGDPRAVEPRGLPASKNLMRGAAHHLAKLTDAQVVEIRERYAAGALQSALAREYEVGPMNIAAIVNGRSWKHIGGPVGPRGPEASERARQQVRARQQAARDAQRQQAAERRQQEQARQREAEQARDARAEAIVAGLGPGRVPRDRRRHAVRELRDLGLTLQAIGDLFGLSGEMIRRDLVNPPSPVRHVPHGPNLRLERARCPVCENRHGLHKDGRLEPHQRLMEVWRFVRYWPAGLLEPQPPLLKWMPLYERGRCAGSGQFPESFLARCGCRVSARGNVTIACPEHEVRRDVAGSVPR